jgi:rubrerythrin
MKMELDGREFYLAHAEKTSNPSLKKILMLMADDELKHYDLFKSMRDESFTHSPDAHKTTILKSVKNVFETMKAANTEIDLQDITDDTRAVWEAARDIEKKAEDFYREKATEMTDAGQKAAFIEIAEEEHRHWQAMEYVVQFLSRPKQWLADAEWADIDE